MIKQIATDISKDAIMFCKNTYLNYTNHFEILDCINGNCDKKFDFIYSVAVIHMLVLDLRIIVLKYIYISYTFMEMIS